MTTTYSSTNSRPCADCGLRRCPSGCISWAIGIDYGYPTPYIPGLPSGPASGQIVHPDGGVVTVPVIDLPAHPADYVTMTGVLNAVAKGPQSHVERPNRLGHAPMWALVCLYLGMVLIGMSMVGIAYLDMM